MSLVSRAVNSFYSATGASGSPARFFTFRSNSRKDIASGRRTPQAGLLLAYQTSPAVAAAAPTAAAATSAGRGGIESAGMRCFSRTGRLKSRSASRARRPPGAARGPG